MTVREIVERLDLHVAAGAAAVSREITGGYSADMLSSVMARAKKGNIWTTLQAHPNVVAVASLLELAAVIVTESAPIPDDVITKANTEEIALLSSPHTTFWVVAELARLGIEPQE